MKRIVTLLIAALLLAAVLSSCGSKKTKVEITVDNYGTITVELDEKNAAITVKNFVKLAKSGFYDGLTFHRIMDGFMIQGGAPAAGSKAPASIKGEFSSNGVNNESSHVKGVISMARAKNPDSGSCQFFITVADATFLDGQYAAFGYVVSGMEVAEQIAKDAKPLDNNGTIAPEDQPVITSVKVVN